MFNTNEYMGTYNVKFFPLEALGYGPKIKQYSCYKPIDLRDVYLINLNGNEAIFERKDGAVIIIPAELILIMTPTEKMEEPILEDKKPKYKVVQEGDNNET